MSTEAPWEIEDAAADVIRFPTVRIEGRRRGSGFDEYSLMRAFGARSPRLSDKLSDGGRTLGYLHHWDPLRALVGGKGG